MTRQPRAYIITSPPEPYGEFDAYDLRAPRQLRTTKRGKRTRLSEETALQVSLVVYYDKRCRIDRALRENTRLYAVNPVPGKTMQQAILSKRMGLRAGIFDLCLMKKFRPIDDAGEKLPEGFSIIWLECKAEKGGYTEAQEDWLRWLSDTPVQYHQVRTLNEFIAILEAK